jgi:hypothetical protein
MALEGVRDVFQTEYQHYGPGTALTPTIRVSFKVGNNGPFTVEVAKADYTPEAVAALMQTIVDQVNAVQKLSS